MTARLAALALILLLTAAPFAVATEEAAARPDAEILSWEQTFHLDKDGSLRRRDHRRIRIWSSRAYRPFADFRIDFEKGRETVTIHKAVTHLTDGTVLPVPGYSLNIAAPSDVAGWPAWAAWQQRIVSFSGLEPGVVLELDYEVVSQPNVYPWIEADLRLEDRYPTKERKVTVILPGWAHFRHHLSKDVEKVYEEAGSSEGKRHAFTFRDLAAVPDEPQSPPWRERCARLAFTTCIGSSDFYKRVLWPVERSAEVGKETLEFAKRTAKGETDTEEQAAKISKTLKETVQVVGSRKTWRSLECRPAATVLLHGYASPYEASALCASLLSALGHRAHPVMLVDEDNWSHEVPGTWAIRDFLVFIDRDLDPFFVHPTEGLVEDPGDHPGRLVLDLLSRHGPSQYRLRDRGPVFSDLEVMGRLTLEKSGKLAGRLKVEAAGKLFDPKALRTEDGRKAWLGKVAGQVVTGLKVENIGVDLLSPGEFRATMKVVLDKPWMKHGRKILVKLGDGPLFPDRIPLPLGRSDRRTDVRLEGAFRERVDVTIEVPEGWEIDPPRRPVEVKGDWGSITETVRAGEGGIRFEREVHLPETIPAALFGGVRTVVNGLRAPASRVFVVGP